MTSGAREQNILLWSACYVPLSILKYFSKLWMEQMGLNDQQEHVNMSFWLLFQLIKQL